MCINVLKLVHVIHLCSYVFILHIQQSIPKCLCLTTQTLQYEVELSPSLEGVEQIHDEWVSHRLQDLPLCSCMGRVFSITHYLSLKTNE